MVNCIFFEQNSKKVIVDLQQADKVRVIIICKLRCTATFLQSKTQNIAIDNLFEIHIMQEAPVWINNLVGGASTIKILKETAYSKVFEVYSKERRFFLKCNPGFGVDEPQVLQTLHKCGAGSVPKVLGRSLKKDAFLITDAGAETLRERWSEDGALELAKAYAGVHWHCDAAPQRFTLLGVPHLNAATLSKTLGKLAIFDDFWISAQWTEHMESIMPGLRLGLDSAPLSLLHHDLHDGNAVWGKDGVTIIDWSEVSLGNAMVCVAQAASKLQAQKGVPADLFERAYLDEYHRLSGVDRMYLLKNSRWIAPYFYVYTLVPLLLHMGQAAYWEREPAIKSMLCAGSRSS